MHYSLRYLEALIENKVEENLNLDYKASGSLDKQNNKTTEISKDVSAMVNSDGGIIIYGLIEEKHLPTKIDPIDRNQFPKEWLEQIIQDKIRPRISNFKIHPIEIDSDHVVYIVLITKGNTAHQAFDKRYYKRFNFQSTPMYDYEIRDVLNRSNNAIIDLEFELENRHSELVVFARNNGNIYAKYANVKLRLPEKIVEIESHQEKVEIVTDNTVQDVTDITLDIGNQPRKKYGPARYVPILPSQRFLLTRIKLQNYPFDYEHILEWEIFCDNAIPKNGKIRLQELLNK